MTDAVIGTLDYIGDFGYMVNSVLDSNEIDDCSTGPQTNSEIGGGCTDDGDVTTPNQFLPAVAKSRSAQRSKGRPVKPMGSASNGGCRSVIQCSICSKTFNNSSALAKHKLIHSDERKYACNLCSKAFKRQDHLNGHMMTHYSKKPYECKFIGCDKSYCDARSLRRHLENHHQQMMAAESGSSAANSDSGTLTPASAPPEGTGAGMSVFKFDSPFLQSVQNGLGSESGGETMAAAGMWPAGYDPFNEPKPVKCTMCDRRFRNLPALNGHMRLHGGYTNTKKDVIETKPEESTNKPEQCTPANGIQKEKHASITNSVTSPLLPPKAVYTKSEVDASDCLIDQQSSAFQFPAIDSCSTGAEQQLPATSGQHSNLFDHSWLDEKQSNENAGLRCVDTVKLETTEVCGQTVSNDCCQEIDFSIFSGDEFFSTELSLVPNSLDDITSNNQSVSTITGLGIDGLNQQQQMVMEEDLPQYNFNLDRHIQGNIMKDSATNAGYGSSAVKSPVPVVSNAPGMFVNRNHSFPDQSNSSSGGFSATSGLQQTSTNLTTESYPVQQTAQLTPAEARGILPRYSSCFQFTSKTEQDSSFHYPSTPSAESDVLFVPSHGIADNRDSFGATGHPSTPKTPMFSSIGVKLQQMNLRTPRTPYSPSTPNRSNRFQFPASTIAADSQTHGYQKPAGYHPYVPSIQQQPPSSPHFLNQRHLAMLAQQERQERHRFRHDVAQAQQVIDQHLHQLHQKDILKHQHSMHNASTPSQSDQVVFKMDSGPLTETKPTMPGNDVFDLLFQDQQSNVGATLGSTSHTGPSMPSSAGICQSFVPEKVNMVSESSTVPIDDLADLLGQKKNKRKHKPEPLVIPPDVSNFDPAAPGSAGSRVSWENNSNVAQGSNHQDFMMPSYVESSGVVNCGMAGGSWIQRNVRVGMQPQSAPAPMYWPTQSYDSFDGRSVEARLPP